MWMFVATSSLSMVYYHSLVLPQINKACNFCDVIEDSNYNRVCFDTDVEGSVTELEMRINMQKSESIIQREIEKWLCLNEIFSWRQNSGGNKRTYQGKERFFRFIRFIFPIKAQKALKAPDINCLHFGKFISIEVKVAGEEPDQAQQNFLDFAESRGGCSFSVTSLEEVVTIFKGLFPNEKFKI